MENPLVHKALTEGVASIDVSMLSSDLRRRLLSDVGDKLLHTGALSHAADAYTVAGDTEKLRETGAWLLEQRRFADAVLFLKHVKGSEEMERLAQDCVVQGEIEKAKQIYASLGNTAMVQFLEQNL